MKGILCFGNPNTYDLNKKVFVTILYRSITELERK